MRKKASECDRKTSVLQFLNKRPLISWLAVCLLLVIMLFVLVCNAKLGNFDITTSLSQSTSISSSQTTDTPYPMEDIDKQAYNLFLAISLVAIIGLSFLAVIVHIFGRVFEKKKGIDSNEED